MNWFLNWWNKPRVVRMTDIVKDSPNALGITVEELICQNRRWSQLVQHGRLGGDHVIEELRNRTSELEAALDKIVTVGLSTGVRGNSADSGIIDSAKYGE